MIRARLSLAVYASLSLSLVPLVPLSGCGGDSGAEAGGSETGDGDGDPSGDGDGDPSGDGDGDPSGDGDGDPSGDGDGDPSGDGDGDPSGDGDGDSGVCGDGIVDPGEACDDGADIGPSFDCLADCTLNQCGDSNVGPSEGCDDGNLIDGDGCSATCTLEDVAPGVIFCGNKVYECGDTLDNDMDGLIDLADPECISPCDDSEGSFETDLPGQNNDCKGDCYFDANSGGGDDNCEWDLKCDPENPGALIGCEYDPNFGMCELEMPQTCLDFCTPQVPNGCDCFGCCEIAGEFVYLGGADCSLDNLDGCQSCTFFEGCNNTCEPENCELCFGQSPEDLPPGCSGAACPEGVTSCEDIGDCADGYYCLTGCCVEIVPQ